MEKRVICDSGLEGWQCRLRDNYSDLESFEQWDSIYNLAQRLGFENTDDAWEANPVIQGSTNPKDFRSVKTEDEAYEA